MSKYIQIVLKICADTEDKIITSINLKKGKKKKKKKKKKR